MTRDVAAKRPKPGIGRNRRTPTLFRLWVAVVIANLVGVGVAVLAAQAIRGLPASAGVETAWRAGYYITMFAVALVDALWVDELAFHGSFRVQILQGQTPETARGDQVAATLQRPTFTFPIVVLAAFGLTYLFFNLVNRDFDVYDRRVGRVVSDLRGDAPEDRQRRLDAIATLSLRGRPEVPPILIDQLEREDQELAGWAAWALGRMRPDEYRKHLVVPLVRAYRRGEPTVAREAMLALARLQHQSFAENLAKALDAEMEAGGPVDVRLAWGLGYVQVIDSVPTLQRALDYPDPTLQRIAAWALAQHRDVRGGRKVVDILHERIGSATFELRCAIVNSLGILQDERSNLAYMHAFDSSTKDERYQVCEPLLLSIRPDGSGNDEYKLFDPRETLAMKVLISMGGAAATTPEIRAQVEPWLEQLIASDATLKTREAAESLLSGIRSGPKPLPSKQRE
jgi:HEAT repeat protein